MFRTCPLILKKTFFKYECKLKPLSMVLLEHHAIYEAFVEKKKEKNISSLASLSPQRNSTKGNLLNDIQLTTLVIINHKYHVGSQGEALQQPFSSFRFHVHNFI